MEEICVLQLLLLGDKANFVVGVVTEGFVGRSITAAKCGPCLLQYKLIRTIDDDEISAHVQWSERDLVFLDGQFFVETIEVFDHRHLALVTNRR